MPEPVTLAVYDLSQGLARQLSPAFLGRQIDGIWHTGVRVYGREYYFGGGICTGMPGATPYGTPVSTEHLGNTEKSYGEFSQFLSSIMREMSIATYHLLDNNCNHFSDRCSMFLVGRHIPRHILELPQQAMSSPLGPMLRPIIDSMQTAIVQQSIGHEWTSATANATPTTPTMTTEPAVPTSPTTRTMPTATATSKVSTITTSLTEPIVSTSSETTRSSPSSSPFITSTTSTSSVATIASSQTSSDAWPTARLAEKRISLRSGDEATIVRRLRQSAPDAPEAATTAEAVSTLMNIAKTSDGERAFPALDLLRIGVAKDNAKGMQVIPGLSELLNLHVLQGDHSIAKVMTLRLAVNTSAAYPVAFLEEGELRDSIIEAISSSLTTPLSMFLLAKTGAILLRNVAAAHATAVHKTKGERLPDETVVRLLFVAYELLQHAVDNPNEKEVVIVLPLLEATALLSDGDPSARAVLDVYGFDPTAFDKPPFSNDKEIGPTLRILEQLPAEG